MQRATRLMGLTVMLSMVAGGSAVGLEIQLLPDFNQTHDINHVIHLGDNMSTESTNFLPPAASGRTASLPPFNVGFDPALVRSATVFVDQYNANGNNEGSVALLNDTTIGTFTRNPFITDLAGATNLPVVTDSFAISPALLREGANTVTLRANDFDNPFHDLDDISITNVRINLDGHCPAEPIANHTMDDARVSGLDDDLQMRLANFKADVLTRLSELQQQVLSQEGYDGPYFKVTSGYRTAAYQRHLRDVFERFNEFRQLGVPLGAPTVGGIRQLGDPQSGPAVFCADQIAEINGEMRAHELVNGVNTADNSMHVTGDAFDLSIRSLKRYGLTDAEIDTLARDAQLHRPDLRDQVHFQRLEDTQIDRRAVIEVHSPVNILLEDPLGRRIGFDAESGQVINEIPLASYTGPDSEPEVFELPFGGVLEGQYLITGVGTGDGPYEILMAVYAENDTVPFYGDSGLDYPPYRKRLASGFATAGVPIPSLSEKFLIVTPRGDADLDGDVDLSDLNAVRNNFGSTGLGDIDGNGIVDLVDLNAVRNNFGAGVGNPQPVPEPSAIASSFVMLVSASAIAVARARWS